MNFPYAPVLRHPALQRLLPTLVTSSIGDGMSLVAVTWLVLDLAPPGQRGLWIALCAAAMTVPGALVTMLVGRRLRQEPAVVLAKRDAYLRGAFLAVVAISASAGRLSAPGLALLLAAGSLLRPWGSAGRWTLVGLVLPAEHRLAGNALLDWVQEFGTLAGPSVAALVITAIGAPAAIGLDAASFAVLALGYTAAGRYMPAPGSTGPSGVAGPRVDTQGEPRALRRLDVAGVIALTLALFALYGPVDVALPLHAREDLGGGPGVFAAFATAFGVGSLIGGLLAGWLHSVSPQRLTAGIVLGWGLCLLPVGLGAPLPLALASFGLGALIYAPYLAVTTTLLQAATPAAELAGVLALRASLLNLAVPLGAVAAGPFVDTLGPATTITIAALATVALGIAALVVALRTYRRRTRQKQPAARAKDPAM